MFQWLRKTFRTSRVEPLKPPEIVRGKHNAPTHRVLIFRQPWNTQGSINYHSSIKMWYFLATVIFPINSPNFATPKGLVFLTYWTAISDIEFAYTDTCQIRFNRLSFTQYSRDFSFNVCSSYLHAAVFNRRATVAFWCGPQKDFDDL